MLRELRQIEEGFANCREALGWDHDIMVHCHWEYDVRTAIQIAEAVAPIKPVRTIEMSHVCVRYWQASRFRFLVKR